MQAHHANLSVQSGRAVVSAGQADAPDFRHRLITPLLGQHRLCLLCAPAGYGKTVLLRQAMQCLEEGSRVVWVSLAGKPLSLEQLSGLIATELGLPLHGGAAPALLRHIVDNRQPLRLILDDLPAQRSVELDDWFDQLLALPSSHFQLLVSARQRPGWNLPRLALTGQLQELDVRQLAFSRPEFNALVDANAASMSVDDRESLWQRSGGWCAGVRLSLSSGEGSRVLLREYLEHEVLTRIGEEERQMLFGLAYLPRFCAELCAQLWEEQDGARLFKRLLRGAAFCFPLKGPSKGEEGWYSLLPLVGQALQGRLGTAELGRLRLHSCRLLSIAGHLTEAIEQALHAQQPEVAANYMERLKPDLQLADGNLHRLLEWRQQLPEALLASTPRLIYLSVLALLFSGRLNESQTCLNQLNRFLPHPDPLEGQRLVANWQALHGTLRAAQGDGTSAGPACREALLYLDRADGLSQLLCYCTLARVAMASGELNRAQEILLQALELARREGCLDSEVLVNTDRVRLMLLQGELNLADALLQESLQLRAPAPMQIDPLRARLLLLQGELHVLRGQWGEGEATLLAGLRHARDCSAPFTLQGYLLLAEIAARRGSFEQSQLHVLEAERRMHCARVDSHLYQNGVSLQRLRILAHQGQWDILLAQSVPLLGRLQAPAMPLPPLLQPALVQETRLLVAQAQVMAGHSGLAVSSLRVLATECAQRQFNLLKAQARQTLAKLGELSSESSDREVSTNPVACSAEPAKMAEVLGDSSSALAGCYLEELTPREVAVLELLAKGLSNQEVSDKLFMSVNTVKYHAKNINTKLGTSRRTQAILFAKAVGIL
ncbi:LuxR C-terminal-related transcriptional regulator [Pseudomonas sp. NPDC089569]|uniref:helix-turn-helix transcriptional regulator n=1 Tax=Pseudomonas sp. NPDC089569 TaxID=3390722 RepID=UPI003D032C05